MDRLPVTHSPQREGKMKASRPAVREFGSLCAKEGKPATGLMSDWLKKGEIEGMNPPPKQPLGE